MAVLNPQKVKKKSFRKHQYGMFSYTMKTRHPALFVQMRLGKCIVVIRRCQLYKPINQKIGLRLLVVSPTSAMGSWEEHWEHEGETFTVLSGTRKQRLALLNNKSRWFLINKEGYKALPQIAKEDWDAVILDESHFIKNPKAKVTKFFTKNFRDVPHRWILTGTPNAENDQEYFCQMQFLDGRFLGCRNFWDFRTRYYEPSFGYDWKPKVGTPQLIQQEIGKRTLVLRRKDVGLEPHTENIKRELDFPEPIRKIYDHAEKSFEINETTTIWSMVRYSWLQDLCGGFVEGECVWDGKYEELLYLLQTALKGEPVVVYYHRNQEIAYSLAFLEANGIKCHALWGEDKREQREVYRRAFQAGEFNVILVQEAVADAGLDLSRADTIVFFSQNPSATVDPQVCSRIVNLNKNTTLLHIHLVVKNSVDSDKYTALRGKKFSSDLSLSRSLASALKERTNG